MQLLPPPHTSASSAASSSSAYLLSLSLALPTDSSSASLLWRLSSSAAVVEESVNVSSESLSSSCPASTGCMCAASPWVTPQTGGFASLGPTQPGANTKTTVIEFIPTSIEPQMYGVCVLKYI